VIDWTDQHQKAKIEIAFRIENGFKSCPSHPAGIELHANARKEIDMQKRELLVGVTAPVLPRLEAEPNLRINAAVVSARTRRAAKTAEVSGAGS
jgi:hypothetical protein